MSLVALVSISDEDYKILNNSYDLSKFGFLQRTFIKKTLFLACKRIGLTMEDTSKMKLIKENIEDTHAYFYAKRYPNTINIAVFHKNIDDFSVSLNIIGKLLNEMAKAEKYDKLMKKYAKIEEMDPIHEVSKNLEDTKNILVESLNTVMERGETLEQTNANINNLEKMTSEFYKKAKKQNRWCGFW